MDELYPLIETVFLHLGLGCLDHILRYVESRDAPARISRRKRDRFVARSHAGDQDVSVFGQGRLEKVHCVVVESLVSRNDFQDVGVIDLGPFVESLLGIEFVLHG